MGEWLHHTVDCVDTTNNLHTVWTGTNSSSPNSSVNFLLLFPKTPYQVKGVGFHVNTNHNLQTWEEIDAVCLLGVSSKISGTILLEEYSDQSEPMTLEFRPLPHGNPILH